MIGTLQIMIDDMRRGVYDFTSDGKCSQCGQCCGDILPLSQKEIDQIRRYIRKHNIAEEVHRPPTVNPVNDYTCPFRNEMLKKCNIYEIRPMICRDFICNKPFTEADKNIFSTIAHLQMGTVLNLGTLL